MSYDIELKNLIHDEVEKARNNYANACFNGKKKSEVRYYDGCYTALSNLELKILKSGVLTV